MFRCPHPTFALMASRETNQAREEDQKRKTLLALATSGKEQMSVNALEEGCKTGGPVAYEKLQFFKTVFNRKMNSKKLDDAYTLLKDGVGVSWRYRGCTAIGLEIASQVFPLFEACGVMPTSQDPILRILELGALMKSRDELPAAGGVEGDGTDKENAKVHRKDFYANAMRWISSAKQSPTLKGKAVVLDLRSLHTAYAMALIATPGHDKLAYAQFLHGEAHAENGVNFELFVETTCATLQAKKDLRTAAYYHGRAVLHLLVAKPVVIVGAAGELEHLNRVNQFVLGFSSAGTPFPITGFLVVYVKLLTALTKSRAKSPSAGAAIAELTPDSPATPSESPETESIIAAIDELVSLFSPLALDQPDPALKQLVITSLHTFRATRKFTKAPSIGSMLSSVMSLMGNGSEK
jgi:hypothetical protein